MSRIAKAGIISGCAIFIWVLVAPWLASRLVVEKPLAQAEIVFVLSGAKLYRERTKKAAEVYLKGNIKVVVLSDDGVSAGWSPEKQRNPKFVELARESLVKAGVPESAIIVMPGVVNGTRDEAVRFQTEAKKRGWDSVLLVTSGYHTRRAKGVFEGVLAGSNIRVGVTASPAGRSTPGVRTWWLSARGWEFVGGEYLKTAYDRIAY